MTRHERRVMFDRLCTLRDRYARLGSRDRRGVITIAQMIAQAEQMLIQAEQLDASTEMTR